MEISTHLFGYLVHLETEPELIRGVVYFLHAPHSLAIKIGFTSQIDYRLSSLQTGSPEPLQLLGTLPANMGLEKALHKELEDVHMRGEWFCVCHPVRELVRYLINVEIPGENYRPELWNCHPWPVRARVVQ